MIWGCACGLGIIVRTFLSLFPHCELSHFSPSIYRQWVPLVSATPLTVLYRLLWNFACIFLMVWGCTCDLDVTFRLFFSLFPHCEHSHFSPSVYRQWVPCEHNSWYNFTLIFLELCTCFLHSLKMYTCFSYNPCHIFVTFLVFLNFVVYWPQMYRQWVPCDCNLSYNFKPVFLKLCTCFLPGLQKCTWFGYDFEIYFCHCFHFKFVIFLTSENFHIVNSFFTLSI